MVKVISLCFLDYRKRSADLAPAEAAGSMNRLPGIAGACRVMRLAGWRFGAPALEAGIYLMSGLFGSNVP